MNEEELTSCDVHCPYCDTAFELLVDTSAGGHATWEDCPRCCAPIQVQVVVSMSGEYEHVMLGRDDDVF
ncbi:CPXCG motif-containing cysteine-rich protein [Halomonas sp. WWR20]